MEVKTGRKLKGIAVGKDTGVVKLAFGSVWAISSGEGNVYRVDPATRKVTAMITVAEGPRFTTEGAGSLWVLTQSDGNVSRIDPATNKVVAVIPVHVPGKGGEICYGGGFIWVTMDGNPVTRIDPATNKVIDQYGNYPKADGSAMALAQSGSLITARANCGGLIRARCSAAECAAGDQEFTSLKIK